LVGKEGCEEDKPYNSFGGANFFVFYINSHKWISVEVRNSMHSYML